MLKAIKVFCELTSRAGNRLEEGFILIPIWKKLWKAGKVFIG